MDTKIQRDHFSLDNQITLFNGDCFDLLREIPDSSVDLVITSPPYCMGKSYENPKDDINDFIDNHKRLFPEIYRVLRDGGSLCWQVGYHVKNSVVTPLDYVIYNIIQTHSDKNIAENFILRNRIVWTFGHGLNTTNRFSGRYETILWYTKGNNYQFHLDSVRIPQKYPGKRAYKGANKGQYSGNPLGKNPSDVWDIPSDVWDIPNVKASHVEKTEHPCQFPVAIPQRLIKALTSVGDLVFDPFVGSGSSAIAAVLEGRKFVGSELNNTFFEIAYDRTELAISGNIRIREDKPVLNPDDKWSVSQKPENFI